MVAPAPPSSERPGPGADLARLDRPQRLGFLPTTAFWKRPDVWKIVGPWSAVFVFLWLVWIELVLDSLLPLWASLVVAVMGQFVFIVVLERYLRVRLRRRALATGEGQATASDTRGEVPRVNGT